MVPKAKSKITKTVLLLGLVSLFTDMASEMLYPIMPFYLKSIGFTVLGIGILEGIAQATAGLSKAYFGRWSDLALKRLPFVQLGYALSALSKPLLAVWANAFWVLGARVTDRIGKGIRTGARDALLSAESNEKNRARIFGFHRSMDTLGASIGPVIAIIFLAIYPESYKAIFLIAFIPGVLAILFTLLIKEKNNSNSISKIRPSLYVMWSYIVKSPKTYKKLVLGLLLFALVNSTDLFLLLYISNLGVKDNVVIWIYVFYNLIYALSAYPIGILADKLGLKKIFIIGIGLFSIVYFCLGLTTRFSPFIFALFLLYGLYASCTEGVAKAWISNVVGGKEVGSAIGNYEAFNSIAAMLSSFLGGLVWYGFGAQFFFIITGSVSILIVAYFLMVNFEPKIAHSIE